MKTYIAELKNGIELIITANTIAEAKQEAKKEGAVIAEDLDLSIPKF